MICITTMIKQNIVIGKVCACCKQEKRFDCFWKRIRAKDGYTSSCIDCVRVQNQKSYKNFWAKNRARIDSNHYQFTEMMRERCNQIKHATGCHFCQELEPICLDFHHRLQFEKHLSISEMINRHSNWDKIITEIEKCVVVCANCHRKVHAGILHFSLEESHKS